MSEPSTTLFGHRWLIWHALEELTPAELQRRYVALFASVRKGDARMRLAA